MSPIISRAGRTWPSARDWCLSIMQHNASPGPAQDGQQAALDTFAAEVIRKAANSAAVIHQNCHRQTCAGCEVRADILDVLRSVADVIGQDSRPADATPEPDFPECVHCGNQSGPLTPTGDRYPSGAQKFECADDCREKANPEPTGRDTELLRTVAAMLRDESARQPERVLVNKGLHHAAQLVDRMANQASAPSGESTPDFFQAAHTYQRRRWLFRCLAVSPNPFNGEVRAVGFLYRPGEPATATALDPDDWSHGDWTNTTNDTTTGDPA